MFQDTVDLRLAYLNYKLSLFPGNLAKFNEIYSSMKKLKEDNMAKVLDLWRTGEDYYDSMNLVNDMCSRGDMYHPDLKRKLDDKLNVMRDIGFPGVTSFCPKLNYLNENSFMKPFRRPF
jgi:hypothetical protein